MNQKLQKIQLQKTGYLSTVFLLLCLLPLGSLLAEGTQDAAPNPTDLVMLLTNDTGFGDFAAPGTDSTSRLYVTFCNDDERLFIKLSREFTAVGNPETVGEYQFQIRNSTGTIVHGPFTINNGNENASSWADATFTGIADPAYSGFYTFVPPATGDYYIEFIDPNVCNIGYWDFTVADLADNAKEGRLWSQNWALRTPQINDVLPECEWDRPFNATVYSYTSDGFVSEIDFNNSGFQGLSFTIAFTSAGPGNTNDPIQDRKSRPGNSTDNAEHKIFFTEPDPCAFPDGTCGMINFDNEFACDTNGDFCLPVTVSQPGQVEILLDFNNNSQVDLNTDDVLLIYCFTPMDLSACVPWDGLKGGGDMIGFGDNFDVVVTYAQGVQHWAVFDGEFLKDGFCVNVIRPNCPGLDTDKLYWDDELIPVLPGTGQPKMELNGCVCRTNGCRTWDFFDPNDADCISVDDNNTEGYGDKNTLNTWWFARITSTGPVNIPFLSCDITGPSSICQGDMALLSVNIPGNLTIVSIDWSGPGGFMSSGGGSNTMVMVVAQGTYTVMIEDANGCTTSCSFDLMVDNCCPCTQPPMISCPANVDLLCNPEDANNDGIPDAIPDPATEIAMGKVIVSSPDMGCAVVINHGGDGPVVQNGCEFSIIRTYAALNGCGGLMASCTQTFTWIEDEVKPSFNQNPPDVTLYTSQGALCPNPASINLVRGRNTPLTTGNVPVNYTVHGVLFSTPNANISDNCSAPGDIELYVWNVQENYNNLSDECMRTIRVVFRIFDQCGNFRSRDVIYTIIDDSPPVGNCPLGTGGLTSIGGVPLPNLGAVAANYTDNCGMVNVNFVNQSITGSDCTSFLVEQVYAVADDCGNTTQCVVTFSGSNSPGPFFGSCPQDVQYLSCIEDVPDPDPQFVAAGFAGSDLITATLIDVIETGDNCDGFEVTHVYEVTDGCHVETCEVTYSGQDFTSIYGVCPPDVDGLECIEDIPDPDPAGVAFFFEDNCGGPVTAVLVQTLDDTDDCTYFSRTYTYWVSDECGRGRTCEVTYSGATNHPSTTINGGSNLSCIDQVTPPDPDGIVDYFDIGCTGEITGSFWNTFTNDYACSGFVVTHFYMVMLECGAMIWVAERFTGTNCPGCSSGLYSEDSPIEREDPLLTAKSKSPFPNINKQETLKAFPNPTRDILHVMPEGFKDEQLQLEVINIYGAVVMRRTINVSDQQTLRIDFGELGAASGLYYLRVFSGDQSAIQKVMLQY